LLDLYPAPHPHTGIERVGERLLAASPDDHLHSFVESDESPSFTAERIVELSDGSRTVRQIARAIAQEFEGAPALPEVEGEVAAFVESLITKLVLVLHDHPTR
jgi:pyrroloquinoline quinone biosynthesis protein D